MNILPQTNQEEQKKNQNIIIQQHNKLNLGISPKIKRKTVTESRNLNYPKLYNRLKSTQHFLYQPKYPIQPISNTDRKTKEGQSNLLPTIIGL